jgi:hypothetical protein
MTIGLFAAHAQEAAPAARAAVCRNHSRREASQHSIRRLYTGDLFEVNKRRVTKVFGFSVY